MFIDLGSSMPDNMPDIINFICKIPRLLSLIATLASLSSRMIIHLRSMGRYGVVDNMPVSIKCTKPYYHMTAKSITLITP